MKKYTIINADKANIYNKHSDLCVDVVAEGDETMKVSDGYHTMDELYDHRIELYIALCRTIADPKKECGPDCERHPNALDVWRSKNHSDGLPAFGGTWFVLGINTEKGKQITYHLPIEKWAVTDFAETFERAPDFDNHTSDDVLARIKEL